jgi:hypothetical protein
MRPRGPTNPDGQVGALDARDRRDRPRAMSPREPTNPDGQVGAGDARDRRDRPSAMSPRAMSPREPTNRDGRARATRLDVAELCAEAKVALKQMGWKPAIAQAAVRAAASALGDDATLERVLVEALRRCPRPSETARP